MHTSTWIQAPYSRKFSLVQNFSEMPPSHAEDIILLLLFLQNASCLSHAGLPNDCHTSSLAHTNLAPPKSVTVKIDVNDDEAKSQVATSFLWRQWSEAIKTISSLVHLFMAFIFVVAHQSKWSARNIVDGHFSSGVCKVGFHCTTYVRIRLYPRHSQCLTHANVCDPMGKPCSCMQYKKAAIFTPSHVRIRICIASHMKTCTSTTSHARICIRYCKSHMLQFFRCSCGCNDFIIWTLWFHYMLRQNSFCIVTRAAHS